MAKFNLSDEDIRPYFALPTVLDGMHSVRVPHMPRAAVAPAARGRWHSSRVALGAAVCQRCAALPGYHKELDSLSRTERDHRCMSHALHANMFLSKRCPVACVIYGTYGTSKTWP